MSPRLDAWLTAEPAGAPEPRGLVVWRRADGDDRRTFVTSLVADGEEPGELMPLFTVPVEAVPADAITPHAPATHHPRDEDLVDWRVWCEAAALAAAPTTGDEVVRVALPGAVASCVLPSWMDARRALHAAVLLDDPARLVWVTLEPPGSDAGRVVAEAPLPALPLAYGCWLDARDGATLHVVLGVADASGATFLCWSGIAGQPPTWAWSWQVAGAVPVPGATVSIAAEGDRALRMTALVHGAASVGEEPARWPVYAACVAGDGAFTTRAVVALEAPAAWGALVAMPTRSGDALAALLRDAEGRHVAVRGEAAVALGEAVGITAPPQLMRVGGDVYALTYGAEGEPGAALLVV